MRPEDVRALALLLPEVVEGAHNGKPDFRLGGRVFATLWVEEERLVVRLPPDRQAALVDAEPDLFEPVSGAWGRRGWTSLNLWDVQEETVGDVLLSAWRRLAPRLLDEAEGSAPRS